MGTYLSQPITEKLSTDEANELMECGASSMQGWRMSQEDAHNTILNFGENSSFFAVYDGHGGSEVALYCAEKLPAFLKTNKEFQRGNYEEALRQAFIDFDSTLVSDEVIAELKIIMPPGDKRGDGETDDECGEGDEDVEDLSELWQEGHMPLNELLEKYKDGKNIPILSKLKRATGASGGGGGEASGSKQIITSRVRGLRSQTNDDGNNGSMADNAGPSCSGTKNLPKKSSKQQGDDNDDESVSSSSAVSSQNKLPESSSSSTSSAGAVAAAAATEEGSNSNHIEEKTSSTIKSPELSDQKQNGSSSDVDNNSIKLENNLSKVNNVQLNGNSKISQENEISTNNAKSSESVSSSSASSSEEILLKKKIKDENGTDGKSAATAAASTKKSTTPKIPMINDNDDDDDDDDSDDSEEDGSYCGEEKSSTDDEVENMVEASDDDDDDDDDDEADTDDDDEDDDEEEEIYPYDCDDGESFLNNMIELPGSSSGCTAVVALLVDQEIYVANAGDSRCVVCRDGKALEMSIDHKPEDTEELERIEKAGGIVCDGRVNGGLNLSRAIGDHAYKKNAELKPEEQMISALPDIKKITISPNDDFMIIACDGIWNFMTSEEVIEFIKKRLDDGREKLSSICEELFTECLASNTMGDGTGCDNMTAVIVRFRPKLNKRNNTTDTNNTTNVTTTADQSTKTKKRSPSPVQMELTDEMAKKRIKTDKDEENNQQQSIEIKNSSRNIDEDANAAEIISTTTTTTAAAATAAVSTGADETPATPAIT